MSENNTPKFDISEIVSTLNDNNPIEVMMLILIEVEPKLRNIKATIDILQNYYDIDQIILPQLSPNTTLGPIVRNLLENTEAIQAMLEAMHQYASNKENLQR